MHNVGLLIINKTKTQRESYFEICVLYYLQLLIQKDGGDKMFFITFTTIYNILQNKKRKVVIHQQ